MFAYGVMDTIRHHRCDLFVLARAVINKDDRDHAILAMATARDDFCSMQSAAALTCSAIAYYICCCTLLAGMAQFCHSAFAQCTQIRCKTSCNPFGSTPNNTPTPPHDCLKVPLSNRRYRCDRFCCSSLCTKSRAICPEKFPAWQQPIYTTGLHSCRIPAKSLLTKNINILHRLQ